MARRKTVAPRPPRNPRHPEIRPCTFSRLAHPPSNRRRLTWIVVLGVITSFMAAFGIGANDVANAYATSVGSKALTVKQACALAVIFEFLGATFLGGSVTKTIRKGIADEDVFEDNPGLLMWGCLCVLFAVTIWLLLATKLEMPVSTTHSCVGGMIGMAIATRGGDAVIWTKPTTDFPFTKGFAGVVISWFLSPIASGTVALILFAGIRTFVLRSPKPFDRSVMIYPLLVAFCVAIITLFMLMKGIKSSADVKNLSVPIKIAISAGVGVAVGVLFIPAYMVCKKRIVEGKFVPPPLAIEVAEAAETDGKAGEVKKDTDAPVETKSIGAKILSSLGTSLNTDPHAAVGVDARTTAVHKNAEKFDKNAEAFFTYLQIFSAIFDSFAHGANDVANAMGPFATIWVVYNTGVVGSKSDMGDNKFWILGLGGVGIGIGLLLYGYQILRAIGVKLAVITPSRGFCIEMGSSLVVIVGSYLGWPLSTTHCQVGATAGVALLEGFKGCNAYVLAKTCFGWVFTCFFVGFLAAIFTSIGAYAPNATGSLVGATPTVAFCNVSSIVSALQA